MWRSAEPERVLRGLRESVPKLILTPRLKPRLTQHTWFRRFSACLASLVKKDMVVFALRHHFSSRRRAISTIASSSVNFMI